jgi:hypothetical protein
MTLDVSTALFVARYAQPFLSADAYGAAELKRYSGGVHIDRKS